MQGISEMHEGYDGKGGVQWLASDTRHVYRDVNDTRVSRAHKAQRTDMQARPGRERAKKKTTAWRCVFCATARRCLGPWQSRKAWLGRQHWASISRCCCLSPTCSLPAREANAPEIPTSREKVPLRYGLDFRFQVPPQFPTVTRWGCGCVQVPTSSLPHLGVPTWTSCGVFWKDCNAFCMLRTSSYDPLRVLLIAY